MSRSELRALLTARAFRPFRLNLSDGSQVEIPRPEFAALSPDGRTLIAFDAATGGMREIIDTLLIVSADFETPAAGG